jgi:putative FmdB family regulatory protein
MPTYQFKCTQCGKTFVQTQTFEEHDRSKRVKCPKCGTTKVTQVIGSPFVKTSKKS